MKHTCCPCWWNWDSFKAWVVNALGKAVTLVLRFSMLQAAHHTRASQYTDFKEIQEREGHRKLCKNRQASPLRKVPLFSQSWICWLMPGIWNGKVQTRFIKPQQAQGKILPIFLSFHSLSLTHTQSQSEMHYPGSGGQLCMGLDILNSEKQKLIMDSQTPLSSSDKIHISLHSLVWKNIYWLNKQDSLDAFWGRFLG